MNVGIQYTFYGVVMTPELPSRIGRYMVTRKYDYGEGSQETIIDKGGESKLLGACSQCSLNELSPNLKQY